MVNSEVLEWFTPRLWSGSLHDLGVDWAFTPRPWTRENDVFFTSSSPKPWSCKHPREKGLLPLNAQKLCLYDSTGLERLGETLQPLGLAKTQLRRRLGRRVRGLTICQYLNLRLSLGGLGGHPPRPSLPRGGGGPLQHSVL